jgi:hypothetical protein
MTRRMLQLALICQLRKCILDFQVRIVTSVFLADVRLRVGLKAKKESIMSQEGSHDAHQ